MKAAKYRWGLLLGFTRIWVPLFMLTVPVLAQAATFSDAFTTLETQFNGFGIWLYSLSLIVGLVLFVWALIKFANGHKTKESKTVPVVMLLMGVCLMSLPFVVSMTASSTLGSDTTNVNGIISGSG